MKEFFNNNKKSIITFLCAVVVIIACAVAGTLLNPEDEDAGRIMITDGETWEIQQWYADSIMLPNYTHIPEPEDD